MMNSWDMRTNVYKHNPSGMTLIELLVVTTVIGILASMLLGAVAKAKPRATRIVCLNNLHQQGAAFIMFANDHNGAFPLDVPVNAGGAREYRPNGMILAEVPQAFLCLSNDLNVARILNCPSDSREAARNFASFSGKNLSFFAGLQASQFYPDSVLSGDRNVLSATNGNMTWDEKLHGNKGNVLLADGHVEQRSQWVWPNRKTTPVIIRPTGNGKTSTMGANQPRPSKPAPPAPKLGDIIEPPGPPPSSPGPNPDSFAHSSSRTPGADRPGNPGLDDSSEQLKTIAASGSPTPIMDPSANRSPRQGDEPDGLAVRLAQWTIAASSLISVLIALMIVALMLIRYLRNRRRLAGLQS